MTAFNLIPANNCTQAGIDKSYPSSFIPVQQENPSGLPGQADFHSRKQKRTDKKPQKIIRRQNRYAVKVEAILPYYGKTYQS